MAKPSDLTQVQRHIAAPVAVAAELLETAGALAVAGVLRVENLEALEQHAARARASFENSDYPLAIGSAKELVETTAKIVLEVFSVDLPKDAKFSKVLGAASHQVAPVGDGVDELEKRWIDRPRQFLSDLDELRNEHGTGHGAARPRRASRSLARLAVGTAELWAGWSLEHIRDAVDDPAVGALVEDLRTGTFRKGQLAARLRELGLVKLNHVAQMYLGLAVGHRAAGATFVVRFDGVQACCISSNHEGWPVAYRAGLIRGLTSNRFGQLHLDEWSVERLDELLRTDPSGILSKEFESAVDQALQHPVDPALMTGFRRDQVLQSIGHVLSGPHVCDIAWARLENVLRY